MTQLGAAAPTTTQAAAVVASSTTTNSSHSCHVLRRSLFISPSAHAADASETTTSDTAAADKEAFLKRWRSVAPSTQVEPGFPVPDEEVAVAADTIPDTLSFSLYLPHKIVFDKMKVESVLVPGTEGDFGVKPGHVPTIAQLRYATHSLSLSLACGYHIYSEWTLLLCLVSCPRTRRRRKKASPSVYVCVSYVCL